MIVLIIVSILSLMVGVLIGCVMGALWMQGKCKSFYKHWESKYER